MQATGAGKTQQLIIRNTAPQEERQARRQFDVADCIDGTGRQIGRLVFNLIQEARVHQQAGNAVLDAHLKTIECSPLVIEGQQFTDFF